MVVISNLLDSMCSCISDQTCGGVPRYDFAAPPSSSSEDVQMADAPATGSASGPSPTDGRQSSSGSPTGSLHSNRSSSPRSCPSPSHFLKFRGANGTEWQSLVRRTSCAGASAGSSTSRPSSPSIQDNNNNTVMRCLDMDNAQMALAHARQQVGARAHSSNHAHKRKASSDIFRSRHNAETSPASAESSLSSDEPLQQMQQDASSERVASPVPLGGLCGPNLNGVVDNGPLGVRSLLRFPGLCFANPIRGSSSFDDNTNEKSSSTTDETERSASPAYLLEQELADKQRQPERPMPLYASQQVVPIQADAGIDNGPISLTDMIRQSNGDGSKKMRLTAPSAPAATDTNPSFAFSSPSDEEEEDASVESTPATMTEGAEGEAPITPTALDAYDAVGTSTTTNTASPPSTNVQSASASAPTHQITPNFTPSTSRPNKQQRMKSPGAQGGGIQALDSGPSVPELMFAGGHQEEAPVTPGQVPMSAPPTTTNVPVTPEKPYFDV